MPPRLPPPQPVPRIAGFATSFLPFHLLAHISHRRSSQLQSLLGQQGSSAVPWSHKNQDPGCFLVCPGVSPSPDSSWKQRAWPWSSCPVHATDPHSKQITALETIAPGRHEPPIICKQPDWLVLQDFCKVCFHLPYSSSCPRASRWCFPACMLSWCHPNASLKRFANVHGRGGRQDMPTGFELIRKD